VRYVLPTKYKKYKICEKKYICKRLCTVVINVRLNSVTKEKLIRIIGVIQKKIIFFFNVTLNSCTTIFAFLHRQCHKVNDFMS
jgi:hypothetical protein